MSDVRVRLLPRATPGLSKTWGRFKHGDKVIIADFVVDVKHPLLPPRRISLLLNN